MTITLQNLYLKMDIYAQQFKNSSRRTSGEAGRVHKGCMTKPNPEVQQRGNLKCEAYIRWKVVCAYDGTAYNGWQSQVTKNTIQNSVEGALEKILKNKVIIQGSGRTDAGVHAQGQVFHFDASWAHGPEKLMVALNSKLPQTIQILSIQATPPTFHARYSAKRKRYSYSLYLGYAPPRESHYTWSLGSKQINISAMRAAAIHLVGKHDFKAFGAQRRAKTEPNPVKEIFKIIIKKGRGKYLKIIVEGSGYLYKMVRSIVGTLVYVGLGKLQPKDVLEILKNKKRVPLIHTAPSKGLVLDKVFY